MYGLLWKSGAKKSKIEKITFKDVQMKFLAMHVKSKIKCWYIYDRIFTWS